MGTGRYFNLIVLAAAAVGLAAGPARAADLTFGAGHFQLIGATNILVNGGLYNMEFHDGTCTALYGGCTDPAADFTFSTAASAKAASDALLTQVFPNFDDISRMRGLGATDYAMVYTPYGLDTSGPQDLKTYEDYLQLITFNHAFYVASASLFSGQDLSSSLRQVYAVWQKAGPPLPTVPLPPSAILFGTALFGLVMLGKRRQGSPV